MCVGTLADFTLEKVQWLCPHCSNAQCWGMGKSDRLGDRIAS